MFTNVKREHVPPRRIPLRHATPAVMALLLHVLHVPHLLLVLLSPWTVSPFLAEPVPREVRCPCGGDAVLPCAAEAKPGVRYRDVRWYQVSEEPPQQLSGILRKNLLDYTTYLYSGYQRPTMLLDRDSLDLVLPNATAQDSGTYSCFLSAPVGQQNQEGLVRLTVTGCPEETPSSDLWFEGILFFIVGLSLFLFFICWALLKNLAILSEKQKQHLKEKIFKSPLQKKTLHLIYTPGLKDGSPYHHVCV
ncbi:CD83 antigen-like [Arapaima gigas]